MRLVAVMGGGLFAVSICCCGDPIARLRSLVGVEEAPPPVPEPVAPVAAPVESIPLGIPNGATRQTASPDVFLRYTSDTMSVDRARQYHDRWFRENGWQIQVDQALPSGWTLEAVKGEHRLTVKILPLMPTGVNVVFKLL